MENPSTATDARSVAAAGATGAAAQSIGDEAPALLSAAAEEIDPRLPLVIGVTGHRDLRPDARAAIAAQVRDILQHFKATYPSTPIMLLSPLAEGGDRLVAEVALEAGIGARLMAPLPMPREIYARDFGTSASRAEFDRLLAAARQSLEMPLPPGVGAEQLQSDLSARQQQYAAVGEFVARHCQVLIALWDGKPGLRGGTAGVVRLKLTGLPPGAPAGSAFVVPRGPVHHVMVPRQRDGAAEITVTTTRMYPESDNYEPEEGRNFYHYRIFKPLDDYNCEALARANEEGAAVQRAAVDLLPDLENPALAPIRQGLGALRLQYAMADALANRYGASTNRTLYQLSIVIFMAALSFDLAIHILVDEPFALLKTVCLFGLPVLTGIAMLIHRHATRGDYQNRYQDYRGLAEGLRVQFFWRIAGVNECVADHYLGRHRYELQWIRNACRGSLVAANCALGRASDEIATVVYERWVDDQGKYFAHAAGAQERKLKRFERRIQFCFRLGFAIVLVLGIWSALLAVKHMFHPVLLAHLHNAPELLHGALLLTITMSAVIAALTHNYVEKLALITQVRMYDRMKRLYRRHGDKLRTARGADFVTGLFMLGREALTENGEWVMTHRERPLEVPHH
jgi:hypothetical protein